MVTQSDPDEHYIRITHKGTKEQEYWKVEGTDDHHNSFWLFPDRRVHSEPVERER